MKKASRQKRTAATVADLLFDLTQDIPGIDLTQVRVRVCFRHLDKRDERSGDLFAWHWACGVRALDPRIEKVMAGWEQEGLRIEAWVEYAGVSDTEEEDGDG